MQNFQDEHKDHKDCDMQVRGVPTVKYTLDRVLYHYQNSGNLDRFIPNEIDDNISSPHTSFISTNCDEHIYALEFEGKMRIVRRSKLFNVEVKCQNCDFDVKQMVRQPSFVDVREREWNGESTDGLIPKICLEYYHKICDISKSHADNNHHVIDVKLLFPEKSIRIGPSLFHRVYRSMCLLKGREFLSRESLNWWE